MPQAGLLFVLSWVLALFGLSIAFSVAELRGKDFANATGNKIMLGVIFGIVLPIALGVLGIVNLWGWWR